MFSSNIFKFFGFFRVQKIAPVAIRANAGCVVGFARDGLEFWVFGNGPQLGFSMCKLALGLKFALAGFFESLAHFGFVPGGIELGPV